MTPHYTDPHLSIFLGDCLEVMPTLEAGSVDAVVTDPPYGLEFMGKEWDRFATGRSAQYARGGELITEDQIAERRGKGGAGPSYVSRPAKRCATCGKQAWSGSPCQCLEPVWEMDSSPLHAYQAWCEQWAREAFRLLKPGGHLLAFGGTRTYHRLTSAIEDAGFEIRDCLVWAYASGFPKSLDVGKAIDRAAGAEREVVGSRLVTGQAEDGSFAGNNVGVPRHAAEIPITAPATDDAKRWDGWGTALKPAWEPIVMARKPLAGTVAANVLKHGTGALNIDATRIGYASEADAEAVDAFQRFRSKHPGGNPVIGIPAPPETGANQRGRWPANVILTDPIFDGDTPGVVGGGETSSGSWTGQLTGRGSEHSGNWGKKDRPFFYDGDTGTYSRFFLIPKEARSGREPAVRGQLPKRELRTMGDGAGEWSQHGPDNVNLQRENVHPTVKPLELMRHLVRLVTPPGGTVLDCFLGSGTTALAAVQEGFGCIGIEREPEYIEITMARLHGTQTGMAL